MYVDDATYIDPRYEYTDVPKRECNYVWFYVLLQYSNCMKRLPKVSVSRGQKRSYLI